MENHERKDDRKNELHEVLEEYFSRGIDQKKFIDVSRIPLICQDIAGMHKALSKIEDNMTWIIRLIIGAIVLALLGLVLIK